MKTSRYSLKASIFTLAVISLFSLLPGPANALNLTRGTPTNLAGTLGNVQANYVPDSVTITGYLDQTGLVSPAPVPIPARRIQYDLLNNADNGTIFEFRVDYERGTTVIGAADPEGYFDADGIRHTFWGGLAYTELFDRGFGVYNYDGGPLGSEWEIIYQPDHVIWRQIGNGFIPDSATGATNFGFNPTFVLFFPPDTTLGLKPASVAGLSPAGGPVASSGRVLSATAREEIEIDEFPSSQALVGIRMPDGTEETVRLSGPTTVQVFLDQLADPDADGREQVPTEMVQLELTGSSNLGPVTLKLRDPDIRRSTGEIEETENTQIDRLDLPPFAPGGTADSFFDVFFEIVLPDGTVLHNRAPKRLSSVINHKPPGLGDYYEGLQDTPLYLPNGEPSGFVLSGARHVPVPGDTDEDGIIDDLDNCITRTNTDQRDTDGDGYGNACDADLNNDLIVNVLDLGLFKRVFFSTDADADFNGDGVVNVIDLGIMKTLFFLPPGPSGIAP